MPDAPDPVASSSPESPRRQLLDPGFGADDGSAAPQVSAALAAYDADPSTHREVLAVIQHQRLLVPVVAMLGESEQGEDGLTRDKTSDMATVLMTSRTGRTALLAFTSTATMQRWRVESRPVPVSAPHAARAAKQDGAQALLIDVAGPVMFVVDQGDLDALADGFLLARLGERLTWTKVGSNPSPDQGPGAVGK